MAGQPVHVFHQQNVPRLAVIEQAEKFGPVQLRAGFVLRVVVADCQAAVAGKSVEAGPRPLRVLFTGGSSKIGTDEGSGLVWYC